jgi:hypothetical protein
MDISERKQALKCWRILYNEKLHNSTVFTWPNIMM